MTPRTDTSSEQMPRAVHASGSSSPADAAPSPQETQPRAGRLYTYGIATVFAVMLALLLVLGSMMWVR